MTKEMETLADKICKEELGQEPNENNLAFRKTLVHGMVRWNEECKVKNISSNLSVSGSLPLAEGLLRSINACDADVMINDLRSQCEKLIENMKR